MFIIQHGDVPDCCVWSRRIQNEKNRIFKIFSIIMISCPLTCAGHMKGSPFTIFYYFIEECMHLVSLNVVRIYVFYVLERHLGTKWFNNTKS